MPVRVIDASALGALVFVEPDADSVENMTTEADLIAPTLLPFEMASICRKKCRAMPERRELFLRILSRVGNMGVHYVDVEPADLTALALDVGVTTYDAAYL